MRHSVAVNVAGIAIGRFRRQKSTPPLQAAHAAFPAWRATPAGRPRAVPLQAQEPARRTFRRAGRPSHYARRTERPSPSPKANCAAALRMSKSPAAFPVLMQGYSLEDVAPASTRSWCASRSASVAIITPFNFPLMIPLWFLPYAIATGQHHRAQAQRPRALCRGAPC
jgi:malonate-semialdehyde dehydrogenase (acetylating) / methylmalonate-semialdehyde dehydrogenase